MDPNDKDLVILHEVYTSTTVVDVMNILYLNVVHNHFYPKNKEGASKEDSKVSGGATINALISNMTRMSRKTPPCPHWRRSR